MGLLMLEKVLCVYHMCVYIYNVCAFMGLLALEKVWVAWPETICAQQLQEWDLGKRKIPWPCVFFNPEITRDNFCL